jgi:hypothetical protein
MPVALPVVIVGGLGILLALLAVGSGKALAAKQRPPALPPSAGPTCSAEEMKFLGTVISSAKKGTANTELLKKALVIAQYCSTRETQLFLLTAIKKLKKDAEKIKATPELVRSPDRSAEPIPKGPDGRPLWTMRADKRAKWYGKPVAIANFPVVLAVFEGLQRAIGVTPGKEPLKIDGRIGEDTKEAFVFRMWDREFTKFPTTAASLAANAAKYTEVLLKGYTPAQVGHYGMEHKSPLPGVSPQRWASFVTNMKGRGSPKGLGMFKMNPTRLQKLGISKFPTTTEGQYKLFIRDMQHLTKGILKSNYLSNAVSEEITLSGVLALAKQGGLKGAKSWLQNSEDREKFPNTTKAFLAANGIF